MKRIVSLLAFLTFGFCAYAQGTFVNKEYEPVGVLTDSVRKTLPPDAKMPEYMGGQEELMKYLGANIRYPKKARRKNIQGKVVVKFVVCEDGTLCNEQVVEPIGGGCDEEVLRVVKSMPPWKPGMLEGKPAKVYYTLPVTFRLD